jgi:small subunit ribosomal protein S6
MVTRVKENNYEAMVILNAQQGETEINALVEKLENVLKKGGANIKQRSDWGRRRLAYPIEKKTDGYYVIFYFELDNAGETLQAFERTCRFDENIMRHMVVRIPLQKGGEPTTQIVPTPGHLSDYRFEARRPRRRPPRPDRPDRGEEGGSDSPRERDGGPRDYGSRDRDRDRDRDGGARESAPRDTPPRIVPKEKPAGDRGPMNAPVIIDQTESAQNKGSES